jgi:hypothetical protein
MMSEEHDRLVKRLIRFGSIQGWSKDLCLDALIKCNWDFNAVNRNPEISGRTIADVLR